MARTTKDLNKLSLKFAQSGASAESLKKYLNFYKDSKPAATKERSSTPVRAAAPKGARKAPKSSHGKENKVATVPITGMTTKELGGKTTSEMGGITDVPIPPPIPANRNKPKVRVQAPSREVEKPRVRVQAPSRTVEKPKVRVKAPTRRGGGGGGGLDAQSEMFKDPNHYTGRKNKGYKVF